MSTTPIGKLAVAGTPVPQASTTATVIANLFMAWFSRRNYPLPMAHYR
jgi:hypothetical protein